MKLTPRLLLLLLVSLFVLLWGEPSPHVAIAAVAAQEGLETSCPDEIIEVEGLFSCMSVEERIGQLLLVTFEGDSAETDSAISNLILNYHIGGVVLKTENDNFSNLLVSTSDNLRVLTSQLQNYALSTSTIILDDEAIDEDSLDAISDNPRNAIPLLIAIEQEGDGAPSSSLADGSIKLPNPMAIGATWDTENAHAVGTATGQQLSSLGINLLLGPTLNLVENSGDANNPGTRSFGGDPFWVGLLAQAYIDGVKDGGDGEVAVIGKYLPGFGGGDDSSVATMRKSLEQLAELDLLPFFAAVTSSEDYTSTVDGLMTAHVRYQGFDGTITDTTPPVSVNPTEQAALFALPALAEWREQGGVVVSDMLGAEALQTFYDDSGSEFPHQRVAKEAFAAGNDLLHLGKFALVDDSAEITANVINTHAWFSERYSLEPDFQQQVDASVKRILQLKADLYGIDFLAESVLPQPEELLQPFVLNEALVNLPAQALTLISPSQTELQVRLPEPPSGEQNIVIFTDMRFTQQCSRCQPQPYIGLSALEDRIIARYGPAASNQVDPSRISSFSFQDLQDYLAADGAPILLPTPEPTATADPNPTATPEGFETPEPTATPPPPPGFFVQEALRNADWIVFASLDQNEQFPASFALEQFLTQQSSNREANIVAFAFNAPYFLDATSILKLSAYYGLYSKTDAFLDTAVQALFQDVAPAGNSPVNIPSVGYDLALATLPDPNRKIELLIVQDEALVAPSFDEPIGLEGGESLLIQTGIILDNNGNPVPDGTIVRFEQDDFSATRLDILAERPTLGGVAAYNFILPDGLVGSIQIRASTGDATVSDVVDIRGNELSVSTPIPPTPTIEPTIAPTETPTPTPSPSPTPTAVPPTATPVVVVVPADDDFELSITLLELQALLSLFAALSVIGIVASGIGRNVLTTLVHQLRLVLWSLIFALVLYIYIRLDLPGAILFDGYGEAAQAVIAVILGGSLGVLTYYVFNRSLN